jgi:L-alanine-DL-glutamate epimerase-like enolase superfamily enzyme
LKTAHGVETTVDVVVAEISDVESRGRGECVPLRRYGESADSVVAALEAMKGAITSGLARDTLQSALPPGAARNALDCAFWDMDAKRAYCSVAELAGLSAVAPVVTAFTLDFDTPEKMAEQAAAAAAIGMFWRWRYRAGARGAGGGADDAPYHRCQ